MSKIITILKLIAHIICGAKQTTQSTVDEALIVYKALRDTAKFITARTRVYYDAIMTGPVHATRFCEVPKHPTLISWLIHEIMERNEAAANRFKSIKREPGDKVVRIYFITDDCVPDGCIWIHSWTEYHIDLRVTDHGALPFAKDALLQAFKLLRIDNYGVEHCSDTMIAVDVFAGSQIFAYGDLKDVLFMLTHFYHIEVADDKEQPAQSSTTPEPEGEVINADDLPSCPANEEDMKIVLSGEIAALFDDDEDSASDDDEEAEHA